MNTIKAIYKAPITIVEPPDCMKDTCMWVDVKYNGKTYHGQASCHPDDMDFFSKRVGYTLAVSRARILAMKDERERVAQEVYWKGRTYMEISQGKDGKARFPEVWRNYIRAAKRLEAFDSAIKTAEDQVKLYVKEQTKAIDVVRRFRAQGKSK